VARCSKVNQRKKGGRKGGGKKVQTKNEKEKHAGRRCILTFQGRFGGRFMREGKKKGTSREKEWQKRGPLGA